MESKNPRRHVETSSVLGMRIWTLSSGLLDTRTLRGLIGGPSHPLPCILTPTAGVCFEPGQQASCLNSNQLQRGVTLENKILADAVQRSPPLLPQYQRQTTVNGTHILDKQIKPLKSKAVGIAKRCHGFQKNQPQEKESPNATKEDTQGKS